MPEWSAKQDAHRAVPVSKQRVTPKNWSGRRESNPRMKLGKLPFYH